MLKKRPIVYFCFGFGVAQRKRHSFLLPAQHGSPLQLGCECRIPQRWRGQMTLRLGKQVPLIHCSLFLWDDGMLIATLNKTVLLEPNRVIK